MSLEPTAKVVVQTTKGEIHMEIFAKETATFLKPFLQNCLDNKYKGIPFGKVLPYLVQTDGNGEGTKFKKRYHLRLKFSMKGCVGLVNSADSKSATVDGFFITSKEAPELNEHFVMIGRVIGDSIYNVIKMSQNDMKEDGETPVHPVVIEETRVTEKYFDDIEVTKNEEAAEPKKKKRKAVKLDYGEDEEDTGFKMRSAHETLDDKRLGKGKQDSGKPDKNEEAKDEAAQKESIGEVKHENGENGINGQNEVHPGEGNKENHEKIRKPSIDGSRKSDLPKLDIVNIELATRKAETGVPPAKPERDPDIDPPYDSDLDLPDDTIEYEDLCKHKFTC